MSSRRIFFRGIGESVSRRSCGYGILTPFATSLSIVTDESVLAQIPSPRAKRRLSSPGHCRRQGRRPRIHCVRGRGSAAHRMYRHYAPPFLHAAQATTALGPITVSNSHPRPCECRRGSADQVVREESLLTWQIHHTTVLYVRFRST